MICILRLYIFSFGLLYKLCSMMALLYTNIQYFSRRFSRYVGRRFSRCVSRYLKVADSIQSLLSREPFMKGGTHPLITTLLLYLTLEVRGQLDMLSINMFSL